MCLTAEMYDKAHLPRPEYLLQECSILQFCTWPNVHLCDSLIYCSTYLLLANSSNFANAKKNKHHNP